MHVGHAAAPRCVKWAPRRLLMASACLAVALWVPEGTAHLELPHSQAAHMQQAQAVSVH